MSLSSDYPVSWGSGFQDPASDWLICLIDLHDQIVFYLIIIASLVIWFTITSIWGASADGTGHLNLLQHGNSLEFIWTIIGSTL
jgi:heme/copper-type cytochrome/quinol oxidase subunit 2